MTYAEYIKTNHWQRTRLKRLIVAELSDEFNAVRCEHPDCRLWFPLGLIEVHHKHYRTLGREKNSDLAVLCFACHGFTHGFSRPLWWHAVKDGGGKLVTFQTVKRLGAMKHIGEVLEEMLERHFRAITHPEVEVSQTPNGVTHANT